MCVAAGSERRFGVLSTHLKAASIYGFHVWMSSILCCQMLHVGESEIFGQLLVLSCKKALRPENISTSSIATFLHRLE